MTGHAVVIGGGIAGLLATRALSSHFEQVTLLERDRYPRAGGAAAPPARPGAPQSRCLHLLLAAGAAAFDQLAPGWREDVVELGAIPFDACADAALRLRDGWLPRAPSTILTVACSRALLERALRGRIARELAPVVRQACSVVGLLGDGAGGVAGVAIVDRRDNRAASVPADLVVDASGRGSSLPLWLSRLRQRPGTPVRDTVIPSARRYASRWFHMPPGDAPDWQCLSIAPTPDARGRAAMMLRAERDWWGVVLLAPADEPIPADDRAFLDFAERLGDGELGAALARARAVSPIYRYGMTASRWRHYEQLEDWPQGLIALGDSACALDPYHGLGMTAAARGVALLARHVQDLPAAPSVGFQTKLAALNASAWELVTGHDTRANRLPRDGRGLDALFATATADVRAAHELLEVHHLLRPAPGMTSREVT
jgi:2-polyprenyl-6-methoxyphenol hydroxylase-like FAD-dependent oxidoreductase